MEQINLTTEDNIELSGSLWSEQAFASVLLIHQLPAVKESWNQLAERLAEVGFNVLAIDLRGHGQSGGGNYENFSSEEHQQYTKDLVAGVEYLKSAYPHTEIYLGGASIGANVVIKYMSHHPEVSKGFCLSAGIDYHGIKALDAVKNLDPAQKLLLVGSRDDQQGTESNGQQIEQLYELAEGVKEKIIYDTGGHGTNMFTTHPEMIEEIVDFLTT